MSEEANCMCGDTDCRLWLEHGYTEPAPPPPSQHREPIEADIVAASEVERASWLSNDHPTVQAFVRHRLAFSTPAASEFFPTPGRNVTETDIEAEGHVAKAICAATLKVGDPSLTAERIAQGVEVLAVKFLPEARAAIAAISTLPAAASVEAGERAQIVAWLRGHDHGAPLTIARQLADAIERGDHLAAKGKDQADG